MSKEYTMSDEAIGQVAKLLQIAILTGTDIVDNLRTLKFNVSKGILIPSPGYLENFNQNIEKLVTESGNTDEDEAIVDEW